MKCLGYLNIADYLADFLFDIYDSDYNAIDFSVDEFDISGNHSEQEEKKDA